jgi:hypothetical protein
VRKVREELAGLGGSTESMFLAAGERLLDLQRQSREIAIEATSFATRLADDGGSLAVLGEALATCSEAGDDNAPAASLPEIHENAKAIQQAIRDIIPVVKTFDVLGVMVRIESARFQGADATFVGLAETVTALSGQIRERIGATTESAESLVETTGSAIAQMRRVEQQRRETLAPLAHASSLELARIRQFRGRASAAVGALGARFEKVSHAFSDVVAALQSHDIVRQQIEHVVQALRNLDSEAWNPEIVRLQVAQLNNSRETFEASAAKVRDAFSSIERNVDDATEEAALLAGASNSKETSFLAGLESNLAGILGILENNVAADRSFCQAGASVRERIGEIVRSITGVRSIGIEMRRIALNATIEAARLGAGGGALEIAAHAIQAMARETEHASNTLERLLNAMKNAASGLRDESAAQSTSAARMAQIRLCLEDLGAVREEARRENTRIDALTGVLKRKIRETVVSFRAHGDCLAVLAQARDVLERYSSGPRSPDAARMAEIESMYTMQSERAIHEATYSPAATNSPSLEVDNVEFF